MTQSSASRASCPVASLRRNTWRTHYRSLSTRWTHRVTHPSSLSGPEPRVPTFPTASSGTAWITSLGINTKRHSSQISTCRCGHLLCSCVRAFAGKFNFGLFFFSAAGLPGQMLLCRFAWPTAFASSGTSSRRPSSTSCLLPRHLCLSARSWARAKVWLILWNGVPDANETQRRTWPCTSSFF